MDTEQLKKVAIRLQNSSEQRAAFSEMVRLTQQRLYWHIRKMVLSHDDANDVLQNTFIKAWNGLSGFRGDSQLFTWLYRIATNETLTFLASERMKNSTTSLEYEDVLIERLQADNYFDGAEVEKKLERAIVQLPEKQRLVFNMRYYDELPYEEMSEILGTSVGALKASYHLAVKKIEIFLTSED